MSLVDFCHILQSNLRVTEVNKFGFISTAAWKINADWVNNILRRDRLVKHDIGSKMEGREDEEEKVNSYWMKFRKREDTGH
jgi:hypothetical protein